MWSSNELLQKARTMVEATLISHETSIAEMEEDTINRAEVQVRWLLPRPGEVSLNCDGSVISAGVHAAYGGILRDDSGNFLFGFAMKLGSCSILAAELWGILHGLRVAWS